MTKYPLYVVAHRFTARGTEFFRQSARGAAAAFVVVVDLFHPREHIL